MELRKVDNSGPIPSGLSYTFSLPNGTHSYTFSTSNKNQGSPNTFGSISVPGKSVEKTVIFTNKYEVTFNEKGLPTAFRWEINIDKHLDSLNTSMNSIHFYLLNGSYLFTVSNTADYLVAPSSGNFEIEFVEVLFTIKSFP